MNSRNNEKQDYFLQDDEPENSLSIEDFIKELEAKEKDLHISSDLAIEIEDDDFSDDVPAFLHAEIVGESKKATEIKPAAGESANLQVISRLESEVSALQARVTRTETERLELVQTMRRHQLDFDNYRKRIERDRNEHLLTQVSGLATRMLPVLDNLHRALDFAQIGNQASAADFHKFFEGIVLVNKQLNEVLAAMGIQSIQSVGEPFDPHFHEAVATEETAELPPNTITSELLRGYRIGDKVIRPALVRVSVAPFSRESGSAAEIDGESSKSI